NFYRKLYGYRSYSYYGKYTYIKEGVLSNINYIKPTKSNIIVSIKDSGELRAFFKKHNVVFDERIVVLDEKDAKKLGLGYPNDWNKIYEEIKENPNTFFYIDF
ncbi:MAG: hypothetical protein ACOC1P_06865, partial [Minisyncoccales bacterium]